MSDHWLVFMYGWLHIADGLVEILTLGYYCPDWSFRVASWRLRRGAAKWGAERKRNE